MSFLSIVQPKVAKTKYSKIYNDCFYQNLGVEEAWSLGIIWLNTVVFLWILVKKTFCEYFQQWKYTADFYMLLIY